MGTLVDLLRDHDHLVGNDGYWARFATCSAAADEIETLREANIQLTAALEAEREKVAKLREALNEIARQWPDSAAAKTARYAARAYKETGDA